MKHSINRLSRPFSIALLLIALVACQADINFTKEQKLDPEGSDYATLSWSVLPQNNVTPTRVTLEPGFGDVDFTASVDVYPEETTTYTLTVYAEIQGQGIANTVFNKTVYVGPWVDYDLFTDPNMRACAEEYNYTHIEQFGVLVCTDKNIQSIQGIEQLTNLRVLTLDINNISDLSPLNGLNDLDTLSLVNNEISDLSSLPYLPGLSNLVLSNNQITDITPLAENPQLTNLAVNENLITDTEQFNALPNLTSLSVTYNQITDISGLGQLSTLELLDAKHNQLTRGVWDLRTLDSALLIDLRNNPKITCLEYANLIVVLGKAVLFNECALFPTL